MKIFYIKLLSFLLILQTLSSLSFAQEQSKTFVLVHGAWGGSWSFKQIETELRNHGHKVYRPCLTGQGERVHLSSPDIDLNTHILDVVNTILYENLQDIILIGHSYGGMVITGVADSIPERISKMIFLDAFVPNDGESLVTSRDDGQSGPEKKSVDGYVTPEWISKDAPLPKDEPQSLKTFTTPVSRKNKKAFCIPTTYILTVDKDRKTEDDAFYHFSKRAHDRKWKIVTMTADHNPQLTKTIELTEILIDESF